MRIAEGAKCGVRNGEFGMRGGSGAMRQRIDAVPPNYCDLGVITPRSSLRAPNSALRTLTPNSELRIPHSTRRDFLHWASCGLGGAALLHLLGRDRPASAGGVP